MPIPGGFWNTTTEKEGTADRLNSSLVQFDTAANRPAAASGNKGMHFVATDTLEVSYSTGSAWIKLGTLRVPTTAEAEAGTSTVKMVWTPALVKKAILKLDVRDIVTTKGDILAATAADVLARVGVGNDGQHLEAASGEATGMKWATVSAGIKLATGTYTGDGGTSQAITGIGGQVVAVQIYTRKTGLAATESHFTTDVIVDDIAAGADIRHVSTALNVDDNHIISLDADGFTVDDDAGNFDPNKSGTVYNYMAFYN